MKEWLDRWLLPLMLLTATAVLVLDLQLPHGVSVAPLYFIAIAVCLLGNRPVLPVVAAAMATLYLGIGFFASPPGGMIVASIINRSETAVIIWVMALVIRRVIIARSRLEEASWLTSTQAQLATSIRGDESLATIADNALRYLARHLGAAVGALYTTELTERGGVRLTRTATYAFPLDDPGRPSTYELGEGLVGQAAVERELLQLAPPPGYLTVGSGLGAAPPRRVLALPLSAGGDVRGVLELGFLTDPDPRVLTLLEGVVDLLANAVRAAQQKERLAVLLEETQQQAEELQSQQEEMSALNEELEQQNKALLESRNQLENQHAELEQTNQVLEEQKNSLDERNRRLAAAERSLQQQKRDLERASRYKSEFLANMSHELRTPLNSALILSKLLADNKPGNLNEEQVRFAQTIHGAGNDLLNLINDILDLSKVEAGKLEVRPEPLQIRELLKPLQASFEGLAKEKGLRLTMEVAQDVPDSIVSDRQRLEQILRNFLSNAFKFTEHGEVALHVSRLDEGVRFSVRDSGVGIPEQEQQAIFEAFRQADGTDSRKYGGTGLGLAITRQLARLLGGEISVQSEPGKGSTFSLTLPPTLPTTLPVSAQRPALEESGPVPLPQTAAGDSGSSTPPARLAFSFSDDREGGADRDRQILIIEDDERFARVLYDLAHEMGFTALVSPAAEEGLALARDFRPSGILLDIRLPDQSGLAVLEQLKSDPRTRHIPVHVVSGEDLSVTVRRLGATGSILKPVKRDELEGAFRDLETHISQKIKGVLVVEDDAVQRESIARLIGGEDVRITAVETAEEALQHLASHTYDCMIMDLNLPDMAGQQLLAQLAAADSPYSYPPVIVYTGRDLSQEEEDLLRRYSSTIIIKGARSPERLLSEVTLFLHRVETELPPERQKMLKDLRSREVALAGARILLADDDVRNIFALTSALEPHGAQIIVARDGREALARLDEHPDVDLVLMDVMMPEMNGLDAMRAIRTQERFKKLPIIAVTAKARRDDQQRCLQAGANDYLAKPIDLDKLLSLIRVWLSSRKGL